MGELSVARVLWLLGQDEQLLRPRVGVLPVAVAAGALVDVVESRSARWVGAADQTAVEVTASRPADPLTSTWATSLAEAAGTSPIRVVHAINALAPGLWDAVGADLADHGMAQAVPRPVRRWLSPRHRPDPDAVRRVRGHLRGVIAGAELATPQDRGVLAVASCAGVVEQVLSQTAFTDSGVLEPTREFLRDSDLVRRMSPAVSYLVSAGPVLGIQQA